MKKSNCRLGISEATIMATDASSRTRRWLCALAVLAAFAATSTSATADPIQYPGSTLTEAIGINNAGTVVGVYTDSSSVGHSFIYSSGTYTSFDDPSATSGTTQATGINNSGTVVGNYVSGGAYHGFERSAGGTFTTLSYPGANTSGTLAFGINDSGDVAGQFSVTGSQNLQSFLYLRALNFYGVLSDPNAGSGPNQGTAASGINNSDEVVGTYRDSSGLAHGFVYNQGTFTTLDDPNALPGYTFGVGINNNGVVSGYYVDPSGHYHGFTESNGIYATVNDPNPAAVNTQLFGINDTNQGAGVWADSSGHIYSSSNTVPVGVPEPCSLTLFVVGGLCVGGLRIVGRRRKARGGV
jgi:hypothetical protein